MRVIAGAAVLTPSSKQARWTTSDRCDGTLVAVTKGSVRATATKGRKRTVTVKPGRPYLVKAKLFAVRAKGA